MLEGGANLNSRDRNGNAALTLAARCDQILSVRALLEAGADVHSANVEGCTALHASALNSSPMCMSALIDAGSDVNRRCGAGITALHIALRTGSVGCVQKLVAAGARLDLKPPDGETPLESVKKFLKNGTAEERRRRIECACIIARAGGSVRGLDFSEPALAPVFAAARAAADAAFASLLAEETAAKAKQTAKAKKKKKKRFSVPAPELVPALETAPEPAPASTPFPEPTLELAPMPVWNGARVPATTPPDNALLAELMQKLACAEERANKLAEGIRKRDEELLCSVCLERQRTTALSPCGHTLCGTCANLSQLRLCPDCRGPIERKTRIYGL